MIDEDLKKVRVKKQPGRHLTKDQIRKRRVRALLFAQKVSDGNEQYVLTIDEALLSYDHSNGQTNFYYTKKEIEDRLQDPPLKDGAAQFPKNVMFAAGFTHRGPTKFYHIPPKTKMTAELFVEKVLTPMLFEDVPRLYGKEAHKVVLHMDSAPSHTARKTTEWLDANGFKYISKEEWLPYSPELSPMDFFANGYLKSKLKRRQYKTLDGMLRCAKDEWNKIPLELFQRALASWSKRVLAVHKARGKYVSL